MPDSQKCAGRYHEGTMAKRYLFPGLGLLIFLSSFAVWLVAQDAGQDSGGSVIRVVVSMVQLNVAVTDEKGNYVTTLRPSDFEITEDGIPQKVATFEEGNEAQQKVLDAAQDSRPSTASDQSANALEGAPDGHRRRD